MGKKIQETIAASGRILAATLLMCVAMGAEALEVGHLELKSRLGDPLKASIALDQLGTLTSEQIKVRSAAAEDYALMGIDSMGMDTFVRYELFLDGNGKGMILVTTERPLSEPFVSLLVEIVWPNGKVLREFPVLLDP